ncbi:MAG: hypothetical protein IT501_11940 [Rubrivivax sp.]|nr:hypothetical protein [Rubrivivax sp.]
MKPALPTRDLALAAYPQREEEAHPGLARAWRSVCARLAGTRTARLPGDVAHALHASADRLRTLDATALAAQATRLRAPLRAAGLRGPRAGQALALVAALAQRTLSVSPYPTQLCAAYTMLQGRFVEMATGEGKTLATGLAAALAALAGVPVQVLTANDYLVQRDRDGLAPLFDALGLTSACVLPDTPRAERARAYRADIVYLCARELAFDYLKDHLESRGERDARVLAAQAMQAAEDTAGTAARSEAGMGSVLAGLHFTIVDEADSVLLDEATLPLIVAQSAGDVDADAYRRAFALARTLQRQRDYELQPQTRPAKLTDAARALLGPALEGARGALRPARRAHELIEAALAARWLYRRDRDYAIVAGRLQLIDETTGRIAQGRQWSDPLHAMVEIKEGLDPSPPTVTAAQITYQRLFPRCLHLAGSSGTLREAQGELRALYGVAVQPVPLACASRRRWLGERVFVDAAAKAQAIVERVQVMRMRGRPVLVGTDSVAASAALSASLLAAGIEHQLLNAVQDAAEAACVARAGHCGVVTVATNMAGRGTDIRLDAAAHAAGGLHVIAAMRNRARRIDRQLIGRAARHGDPGSAERVLALDDPLFAQARGAAPLRLLAQRTARAGCVQPWLARPLATLAQRTAEWNDRARRHELRRAEQHAAQAWAFAGGVE